MATVTLAQEHNSYIVYNRQISTDSGWENPFRPGGDLSREADEIVELIKEGKPITPTPGNTSPKLPPGEDVTENGKLSPKELTATKKNVANDVAHSPKNTKNQQQQQQSANGNSVANDNKTTVGPVEVQKMVVQPSDASQIEHVIIKKKPKCKCCVIQ